VCIDLFSVPSPTETKRWDAFLAAGVVTYSACDDTCDWGKRNLSVLITDLSLDLGTTPSPVQNHRVIYG